MSEFVLVDRALLTDLCESLAAELDARYPACNRSYPHNELRYKSEMEPVTKAREILAAPKPEAEPVAVAKTRRHYHDYEGSALEDSTGYLHTAISWLKPFEEDGDVILYAGIPPSSEPGKQIGWLIENGSYSAPLYKYIDNSDGCMIFKWTPDANKALRFARRIDAEAFAYHDEHAWRIVEHMWHDDLRKSEQPAPVRTDQLDKALFEARLQTTRKLRDLNQEGLATKAGLTSTAISHFESGTRKPSFDNLRKLADALNVSIDYLMGRTDDMGGTLSAKAEIFRDYEKLTDVDQAFAKKMIADLASRNIDKPAEPEA